MLIINFFFFCGTAPYRIYRYWIYGSENFRKSQRFQRWDFCKKSINVKNQRHIGGQAVAAAVTFFFFTIDNKSTPAFEWNFHQSLKAISIELLVFWDFQSPQQDRGQLKKKSNIIKKLLYSNETLCQILKEIEKEFSAI